MGHPLVVILLAIVPAASCLGNEVIIGTTDFETANPNNPTVFIRQSGGLFETCERYCDTC